MVFTGYFKTEQISGGKVTGYSGVITSCNNPLTWKKIPSLILGEFKESSAIADLHLYMQNEASDLGGGYKLLNDTAWNGPAAEYSSADTAVPIYTCSSADGFFTEDNDLSMHNVLWTINYNGKANDISAGYNAYLDFKFYARDSDGAETYLFKIRADISEFYEVSAMTAAGYPDGNAASGDRLVIKVYYGEKMPA